MDQTLQRKLDFYVGTSGWQYGHWKSVFYPEDLKYSQWLSFYCKYFSTVEINVTFYRNVKSTTFQKWYSEVPENFLFSVKISRQITHFKKLKIEQYMLESFIENVSILRDKLGVILIQLPPSLKFDEKLLKDFTSMLNKNFKYAIEVRNKTFIDDRFFDILKKENIAFCIADSAGRYPYYEAITSDFVYIRLHGSKKLYTSEYTEKELSEWAIKIKNWKMPTFIYFDNDFKGFAVKNALQLRNYLHSEDEKIGQTPSGC